MSEQDPSSAPEKPRRHRLQRWLGITLLILIGLPILLLAAAYLALQTEPGRALLVDVIERSISRADGLQLAIGRLEGPLPQQIQLYDVELRDPEGQLLAIDHARLVWHPLALLERRINVTTLEADQVTLVRLPQSDEAEVAPPERQEPFRLELPSLPLSLDLRRLHVRRLLLAQELVGAPALLDIKGHARVERAGALDAALALQRIDERPGQLDVKVQLAAGGDDLTVEVEGGEPAGGLIAQLLELPGRPPVNITFKGSGPPEGWLGRLVAEAGEQARISADLRLASLQPLDLGIEGTASLEALLPQDLGPLLSDSVAFGARLEQDAAGATELRDFYLTAARIGLRGRARLEADRESLEAALQADLADGRPLAGVMAPFSFGQASLTLNLSGRLSAPVTALRAEVRDFDAPQASLDILRLALDTTTPEPLNEPGAAVAASLAVNGEHLRLEREGLEELIPANPSLTARGSYRLKQRRVTLEGLEASLADLLLELSGEVTLPDAEEALPVGHLVLRAKQDDLSRLASLTRRDLRGKMTLDADAMLHEDGGIEGSLSAMTEGLYLGIPLLDALLGAKPGLTARLRRGEGSQLHLEALQLDAAATTLSAEAFLTDDLSELDASYRISLSALEPLGEVLEQPLGGSLELEGTAAGPLRSPQVEAKLEGRNLSLPGDPFRLLTATLDLDLDQEDGHGRLVADGEEGRYGPFKTEAVFALADQVITLTPFSFELGDAAAITGQLRWPLDGRPGEGRFLGTVPRLDALTAFAGIEADGNLSFEVALTPQEEQQALRAEADLQTLRIGPAGNPALRARQVTLRASVEDLVGSLGWDATLTAKALSASDLTLSQARLKAGGSLTEASVEVSAEGHANDEALRLASRASVDLAEESTAVTLASLAADWAGEEIALLRPAEIRIAPHDIRMEGLELSILGGRLTGSLHQKDDAIDGSLALQALSLPRLAGLVTTTDVEGRLSAELTFSGSLTRPSAELNLFANDLAFATDADLSSRPAVDLRAQASLGQGRLRLDARAEGFAETPLTLEAMLPVRASLQPFVMEVINNQPLDADLHWEGDLGPVMALLPVDTIRITGRGDIDLRASGSLADPQLSGRVAITEGRYENYTTGTVLAPMELVLSGADRRLTLEHLDARDGRDGKVDGHGSLTWLGDEGLDADLHVRFDNMLIAQRDDLTARISGTLDAVGNIFEDATISGQLTNDFIEIRLVDALPPSVAEVKVIEVYDDEPAPLEEEVIGTPSAPSPIKLDIKVDFPRRVFVRGKGLESEWRGHFLIAGNVNDPMISGELNPTRGSFTVVGKSFVLQKGSIQLPVGVPGMDPVLDLTASYTTSNFQALVEITGSASHPEIKLASEPELPQDEILSRVLFNKNSANLTALEAIELADAAASLATGGPGITGFMRRAIGVDQLGFRTGSDENDPGAVTAGTYVGEGIYVGVEQGMSAGSTGVMVEIDITDNIKARSDVTADGQNRASIRWQMDY